MSMSTSAVSAGYPSALGVECAFVALAVAALAISLGSDPKYADLRAALCKGIIAPLPEILGLSAVGLAVVLCLLLHPHGMFATTEELAALKKQDQYLFETRQMWPTLTHPDSLLTIQQLLQALAAILLLIRGACAHSNGALALSLLLLAVGQSVRFGQWADQGDYVPEGSLGGVFGAWCAGICFATTLLAGTVAARSAIKGAGPVRVAKGAFTYVGLLGCSSWLASTHYLTVSGNDLSNFAFSLIDTTDLFAAPLLAIAAWSMATQSAPKMGSALAILTACQVCRLVWFIDFLGAFSDPSSQDPFVKLDLEVKKQLRSMVHGHPFEFMAVSQAVQVIGMLVAFGGYAVLRASNPAPPQVVKTASLLEPEADP